MMNQFRGAGWPRQLWRRWWQEQSLARQDVFAALAPLISVLLFLAAMVAAFWYLRNEEFDRERESVERDTEIVQQQLRLRLIDTQAQMGRLAREIDAHAVEPADFPTRAAAFARGRPELIRIDWLDGARTPVAAFRSSARSESPLDEEEAASAPVPIGVDDAQSAFTAARATHQPAYTHPFQAADGSFVWQVYLPLFDRGNFRGTLVAQFSIDTLLGAAVPDEVGRRHTIELADRTGRLLASNSLTATGGRQSVAAIFHEVPVAPAGGSLLLRGVGHRTSVALVGSMLFWMVAALSALTVWMLLGTLRHMRRRLQMQGALTSETNFRRAMENSMLTGMRAMDLDGVITYVNPAFCAMTGFPESDLVGQRPPFPHWPPDRIDENMRLLNQELQGLSPVGGIEIKMMRKDGTIFDARMYVSPLIDASGEQTGWMTSVTNITEAKRIRDQLTASHERFTTVLEGLDASVSVLSVQQRELLFANHSYRLWFGAEPLGHDLLAGDATDQRTAADGDDVVADRFGSLPGGSLTQTGSPPNEVYIESLQMWFDVRARYLQWTDGRLAQMLIATDITARRAAEAAAAHQAEKVQVTSRLMTMGEMASSVAHELNQPLTAIANYCNGMVSRVRSDAIAKDDLIAALQKTSRQAERAGQIIHRIRAFVKRSEPQRQASQAKTIVDDAVELAGIELRRRNVTIRTYVAQRLPTLMADPILIEQVLLNLLKNAAEAIDMAKLPVPRRNIELRVVPVHSAIDGDAIEFSVTDKGPGLDPDVLARLYEAFFSTKPDGLGIGLSLCRSIIESHRGRIGAHNLYNGTTAVGCRFAFTLPVDTVRPAADLHHQVATP